MVVMVLSKEEAEIERQKQLNCIIKAIKKTKKDHSDIDVDVLVAVLKHAQSNYNLLSDFDLNVAGIRANKSLEELAHHRNNFKTYVEEWVNAPEQQAKGAIASESPFWKLYQEADQDLNEALANS